MRIPLLLFFLMIPLSVHSQLHPVDTAWVESTLNRMSVEDKVGHLIMPAHQSMEESERNVREYHVGGLWFAKAKAPEIARQLNQLQRIAPYGLLVAVDFEKGAGTHVDGGIDLPGAMALAASGDPAAAYEAAAITAEEARALGVHIDFAPVVDVNDNPMNPVINVRSFGEDPARVAEFGAAAVRGYQDHGLLATLKHYPGHGNTAVDSHADLARVAGSMDKIERTELLPYRVIIGRDHPAAVMVSHLWLPALDVDPTPATFSRNAVQRVLRDRLGFDGLVCTDAMVMGAIAKHAGPGEAAIRTIMAGVDLVVWPESVRAAYDSLLAAVQDGRISRERLDASVRRILRAKSQGGVRQGYSVDESALGRTLRAPRNLERARNLAASCITLVNDERTILPLHPAARTLLLTLDNQAGQALMSRTSVTFPAEVQKRSTDVSVFDVPDTLTPDVIAKILEEAERSETVIVSAYVRIFMASGTVDLPPAQRDLLTRLVRTNPRVVLVSFGSPYAGGTIPGLSTYVCAYDNAEVLQEAAARALFGEIPVHGKLPVSISAEFPLGTGLDREAVSR